MYQAVRVAGCERVASNGDGQDARAVVEIQRALGGMRMRALLGGAFTPDPGGATTAFEIPVGGPLGIGSPAECDSELGRRLVAGMPEDFADAAMSGLAGAEDDAGMPAGVLRVDRAAFDEVDSSETAFRLAGDLLRHAIRALTAGLDPQAAARTTVDAW